MFICSPKEQNIELLSYCRQTPSFFKRKKVRYEEGGFSSLLDRRIGHMPPNKVAVDGYMD